jgi:UDP-glucose 4-epimerase
MAGFKPDCVVHGAASYKNADDWRRHIEVNTLATAALAKATAQIRGSRIVYFQTALCYGLNPKVVPTPVTHPLVSGGSSYAISKTAGEHYLALSGADYVSLRFSNVYGPRSLSGPVPAFYRRLTSGVRCVVTDTRRDFVYVDDVVGCVLRVIDGAGRGPYNVCSGSDHSISDLLRHVANALGVGLERIDISERSSDDAFTILLDPSVTYLELGWKAVTNLSVGVQRTIDWYREYGVSQTFTHLRLVP